MLADASTINVTTNVTTMTSSILSLNAKRINKVINRITIAMARKTGKIIKRIFIKIFPTSDSWAGTSRTHGTL